MTETPLDTRMVGVAGHVIGVGSSILVCAGPRY